MNLISDRVRRENFVTDAQYDTARRLAADVRGSAADLHMGRVSVRVCHDSGPMLTGDMSVRALVRRSFGRRGGLDNPAVILIDAEGLVGVAGLDTGVLFAEEQRGEVSDKTIFTWLTSGQSAGMMSVLSDMAAVGTR